MVSGSGAPRRGSKRGLVLQPRGAVNRALGPLGWPRRDCGGPDGWGYSRRWAPEQALPQLRRPGRRTSAGAAPPGPTRRRNAPSISSALVSSRCASGACISGAVARERSRSSRRMMSARMSASFALSPRPRSSRARRRARTSGVAVTKIFTSALGQITVPMSRPSSTAPGGAAANSCWKLNSAARTPGMAETTDAASPTSWRLSAASSKRAGSIALAAAMARASSPGAWPASSSAFATAR